MDRFLRNNIFVRITAFILAIILWFSLNSGTEDMTSGTSSFSNLTRTFEARPIQALTAPGYVVTGLSASKATIVLRGSPVDIASAEAQLFTLKAIADATKLGVGKHVVTLTTNLPVGLHWDIQPSTVTVTIERKINRMMSIGLTTVGIPESGYEIGDSKADPATVSVAGPETAVNSVKAIEGVIDVANVSAAIKQTIRLHALDATGHDVEGVVVSPQSVRVSVPIGTMVGSVPIQFQVAGSPEAGYAVASITSSVSHVNAFAIDAQVNKVSNVPVIIDVSGLGHDVSLSVKPTVPPGVVAVQPDQIDVTVHIVPAQQRTVDHVPVILTNVPKGYNVAIQGPDTVSVVLVGAPSQLHAIQPSDLRVTVDVSQLNEGLTAVPVVAKVIPQYVRVTKALPDTVNVRVSKSGS